MAVYSAMMDDLNRTDRKREAQRIRCVMCHHIAKEGHLSSQPMGALRDFVAHNSATERPAVVNFPVLPHNPYQMDVPAALKQIEISRPELIILGKSMVIYNDYQPKVLANAKAFAHALSDRGLEPAGDPKTGYTETHQVILPVGYGRGQEMAERLEDNNIICNYQATPDEEGFTASGALRLGVSEMTRFGMEEKDFQELAQLMRDVVVKNAHVKARVEKMRQRFQDLKFCFSEQDFEGHLQELHRLLL